MSIFLISLTSSVLLFFIMRSESGLVERSAVAMFSFVSNVSMNNYVLLVDFVMLWINPADEYFETLRE